MSAFSRAAALLVLGAVMALSAEASDNYYPFYCRRGYSKTYYKKYYSGDCDKDFAAIQSYVSDSLYTDAVKYEKCAKVAILICALSAQCFDATSSGPVCTNDGIQFENECFAQCMGYKSDEYTSGACSAVAVVVAEPTPAPAPAPSPCDTGADAAYVAVVDTSSSTTMTSSSDPYPSPCSTPAPAPSPVSASMPSPPCDGEGAGSVTVVATSTSTTPGASYGASGSSSGSASGSGSASSTNMGY